MTMGEALPLLAAALQAVISGRQALAAVTCAALIRLVPATWRARLLVPASVLVLAFGYEKWPAVLVLVVVVAWAVYGGVAVSIRRFGHTRPVVIGLTAVYVGLHVTLGVLTYTDWLAWTGISAGTAIAQCGTVVMFGYLRMLGYAIDAGRIARRPAAGRGALSGNPDEGSKPAVSRSLGNFTAWALFFPTFGALPLIGLDTFAGLRSGLLGPVRWRRAFQHGGQVVLKSLAAAALYSVVQPANALFSPESVSVAGAWLALLAHTLVFFFGFTASVDFAIASAALLGIDLPDNFARIDVLLANVRARDFWRDWNYTVTRWLQDYVYVPLGGHRHGALRNTVLTMVFCGLWHSVSPLGLAWGLALGLMLVAEHTWTRARIKRIVRWPPLPKVVRSAAWVAAFGLIQVAQLPFAYIPDGIAGAARFYARLAGLG